MATIRISIPENGQGGINAKEATDGVIVLFDLSQVDAQAGDTLTVDWGKKITTLTLTSADLEDPAAVSVTVPAETLAARGNGAIPVQATWASQDGQVSAVSDSVTVTVDTVAPAAPTIVSVAENANGGINAGEAADGVTVVVGLKAGQAKASVGDTLKVFWGNQTITQKLTAQDIAGLEVLVQIPANQVTASGQGELNVTAQLTDRAGNVSLSSAAKVVTLDTQAPTATLASLAFSSDTGSDSTDFVTKTAKQTVRGTLNQKLAEDERVQVSVDDGKTWKNATLDGGGLNWSADVTLLPGARIMQVRVVDAVGNLGDSVRQKYILDSVAPTNLVGSVKFSSDSGTSKTDFITKVAKQTLSGTVVGKMGAGSAVEVSVDNGATWKTASLNALGNSWSLANVNLLAGAHTLIVRVVDAAGNVGKGLQKAYQLDTEAPTATIKSVALSADSGESSSDFVTNAARQTLSGTVQGALGRGDVVQVSLDDGATWSNANLNFSNWKLENVSLVGSESVQVRVADAAGNVSAALSQPVVLDTTPPQAKVTSLAFSADSGGSSTDFITNVAAQTLSGLFSGTLAEGEKVQVSFDKGHSWLAVDVNGNQWSLEVTLTGGINTQVQARVADIAGNASKILTQAYTLDTTAPAAKVTSVKFDAANTGSTQTIKGDLSAASLEAGESVLVSLDDGASWLVATLNANQWFLDAQLPSGSHTLQARVVDAAGNEGSLFSKEYGEPVELPVLSIADISVNEGNGGSVDAVLTVSLSAASTQTVTVDYTTKDGTAQAGQDYTAASGTLSFAPGEISKTVSVAVAGDATDESDETFTLVLSAPTNASVDAAKGTATVTIANDDGETGPDVPTSLPPDTRTYDLVLPLDDTANKLDGSLMNEKFLGKGGDDKLNGKAGNDHLDGGDGNDTLIGDAGDDYLLGGSGNDAMNGGPGNDNMDGGEGNNSMNGGDGNDLLIAGSGNDTMAGENGDDILVGGEGNNTLRGGAGKDLLVTGGGNDRLEGGDGDDELYAGDGDNAVYGENGNDSIVTGSGKDWIVGGYGKDVITAGSGNDKVYGDIELITNQYEYWYWSSSSSYGNDLIHGGEGDDLIVDVYWQTNASLKEQLLYGDAGDDTIVGAGQLFGGAGNDFLKGIGYLSGGDGNDTLIGINVPNLSNQTLEGGGGADTITTGAGKDTIVYASPSDTGVGAGNRDVITDFDTSSGDVIDLSGVSSNPMSFILLSPFDGKAGEVRFVIDTATSTTVIEIDLDGNKAADMEIELTGIKILSADDFILA